MECPRRTQPWYFVTKKFESLSLEEKYIVIYLIQKNIINKTGKISRSFSIALKSIIKKSQNLQVKLALVYNAQTLLIFGQYQTKTVTVAR